MKTYNKKGLYNSYDKNHKERNSLDYYSTPTKEVENILNTLDIEFNGGTILEPCCGGGHMLKGILQYLKDTKQNAAITATDIKERAIEALIKMGFCDDGSFQISVDASLDYDLSELKKCGAESDNAFDIIQKIFTNPKFEPRKFNHGWIIENETKNKATSNKQCKNHASPNKMT